jgi:hypothetical protein
LPIKSPTNPPAIQQIIRVAVTTKLGTSESKDMLMVSMDYAKEVSLIKETLHRRKNQFMDG